MYSYISGELVDVLADSIVVDNHGIGYEFHVSKNTLYHLQGIGNQVKVYTYLHVREDAMQLFGFSSKEEREFFQLLINVNGIGPKGALAILSVMSLSDLRFAILSEDEKALSSAPGIGKKTAQRLILDLKDKIDQIASDGLNQMVTDSPEASIKTDVIEAMTSLGYSASDALRAMEGMEFTEDTTLEAVLKEVLKKMSFL